MTARLLRMGGVAICVAAGVSGGCRVAREAEPAAAHVEPAPERVLVAHYFNWFQTPDVRGSWRLWDWHGTGPQHDPSQRRGDGRRDIASVFYPSIGPYDSSLPEVMEYHILLAKLAGIDGFVVDWYSLRSGDDRLMLPLLDLAQRMDFRIGICFEDKAMFGYEYQARTRAEAVDNAISNLVYVLDRYAPHPAYLRLGGRPVVINFSWSEPDARVSSQGFSAAEWNRMLTQVRERYDVDFIHDFHAHMHESYWDVADNVYPWLDVNGPARARFYDEAAERLASGRIDAVAALVYPGFDNTGVWGWGSGPFVTPREDGALYRRLWEEALAYPIRLMQIATWNDFGEGATIEPTDEYGFQYLEITQKYAARWKGNRAPASAALRLPEAIYCLRKELRASPDGARSRQLDEAVATLVDGRTDLAGRLVDALAEQPCKSTP